MNTLVDKYRSRVFEYARAQLEPYCDRLSRLQDASLHGRHKEINDALWGTIKIRDLEVVFLDSPLMQRLRRIRQLGTADYIYPSATHTRLAHSLGVLNRASLMIDSLNAAATDKTIVPPVDEDTTQILRLAALLHDIGHTALSHSTELALMYSRDAREIKNDFQNIKGEEYRLDEEHSLEVSASLTEINSYFLIGSPAMADLFKEAERLTKRVIADSDPIDKICRSVIGIPITDSPPYLHSIVSGPFDADKLDYLPRDALGAGVPNVTDSDRLLRKLRVVQTTANRLPEKLGNNLSENELVTITGVARSGNRALDEVLLGRTLLFDKIYRHHGTREAEALVAEIFSHLDSSEPDPLSIMMLALQCEDAEIIGLDEWSLRRYGLRHRNKGAQSAIASAKRLSNRDLPVRCIAFGRKMPEDPYELQPAHTGGLRLLLDSLDHHQNRRELAVAIANRLLESAGASAELQHLPPDLADRIWVDPPSASTHVGVDDAMLIGASARIVPFDEEAPETVMWAAAYSQTRDSGYIFGPEEFAPAIALSAEAELRVRYSIRLPEIAMCNGRVTKDVLDQWRMQLAETGMYTDCPRDLLPTPKMLGRQSTADRIRDSCGRFSGYQGPNTERAKRGHEGLTATRMSDFLSQFVTDDMIDAALRAIENIKAIGRRQVFDAATRFLEEHADFKNAVIVPFGSARDSSSAAAYFAQDVAERCPNIDVDDLAGAIDSERPILFIDDIIHSGRQAAGIVSAWFGDTALAQELNENRRPLSVQLQQALREQQDRIAMLFVAGSEEGDERLTQCLNDLELNDVLVRIDDTALPSINDQIFKSDRQRKEFQRVCEHIGRQLLGDDPKVSDRCLGYGNHGLLLVHSYNTPAQTITAFWKSGIVDGVPWEPLLPRRSKN